MKTNKRILSLTGIAIVIALLGVTAVLHAQNGGRFSVKAMRPVVVKTVPQAGDTEVDPSLQEIKVTFSKDMADGSWTWSQVSEDTNPQCTGKIHYLADKRTCVMPVKLEPGKTYVLWLNSDRFTNFRDQGRLPAVPYLLVFETKQ